MVSISKIYLVPQIVTDLAQKLFSEEQNHAQQNYQLRLEVIRDFCNEELERYKLFNAAHKEARNPRK
ncbi:MAG: hypothetical protein P4L79_10970 [Legionella sp.]|uniref:hypothetical protein n=1 Tax=Legionella sp. TaxID=459 RepID=UPI00283B0924|nr:hypothetical protein [Legionella sp.]